MAFEQLVETIVAQAPLAGVGIYVARMYMEKHEQAVQKLVATFEGEVKACENRYQMVFDELMKLKDRIK